MERKISASEGTGGCGGPPRLATSVNDSEQMGCERGEVVAALSDDGQRCGQADGRQSAALAGRGARVAFGTACGGPGPDVADLGGGTWRTRGGDELRLSLAHRARCRHQLQKKRCSPPSRTVPTWREGGFVGRPIKAALIRRSWCSSTRPRPKPI